MGWDDVAGIQQRGGTVIGTRSEVSLHLEGRHAAACNLLANGIGLVVIGGDGSPTGNIFRQNGPPSCKTWSRAAISRLK
jgi:6-phosphofructokinase